MSDDFAILTAALERGDLEDLRRLVAAGANVKAANESGESVFWWTVDAVMFDELAAFIDDRFAPLRLLLNLGADPNQMDDEESTVLIDAIYKGDHHMVDFLLNNNLDPNLGHTDNFETMLDLAISDYRFEAWIFKGYESLYGDRNEPFASIDAELAFLDTQARQRGYLMPDIPILIRARGGLGRVDIARRLGGTGQESIRWQDGAWHLYNPDDRGPDTSLR